MSTRNLGFPVITEKEETDRCRENYCDQNLLEKIICNSQEKGEVGNSVAFALLTAGIAPAFVILVAKSIRQKKIAETLAAASLALAGWGVEFIRCLREIRQKCNNQDPELGADEDSSDSDSEESTQQDVANRLNKFFNNTSCSKVSITADESETEGSGNFTAKVLGQSEKFTLGSNEMATILNATTNLEIYNVIKSPLNNKGISTAYCSTNSNYPNGVIGLKYGSFITICNNAELSFEETDNNCPDSGAEEPDSGAEEPDLGAEELEVKKTYGIDNYYPDADVIRLINSATNRINSFLTGSFCNNARAYSVFGLCGACNPPIPPAEFCGSCQGITLKLLDKEVNPRFGENNFIWGNTREFYNNIINANDEELWKIIYTPFFSQLWEELKPNSDAVWNYSNNKLTLKAGGTGYNFCNFNQAPSPF